MREWRVYSVVSEPKPLVMSSGWLRFFTALAFASAGSLLGLHVYRSREPGLDEPWGVRRRRLLLCLVGACFVASLVEATDLGSMVADWTRHVAREHRFYVWRGPMQLVVTVGVFGLGLFVVGWVAWLPAALPVRISMVGLMLWFDFLLVAALSLHAVDRLDARFLPGYSILQVARMVASLATLCGMLFHALSVRRGGQRG